MLLSLESYPDDAQLAGLGTGGGGGGGSELPVLSVLLPRRGVVATAACQALTSMLTLASPSLSSSSSSSSSPTIASLVGWSPQGCGSVVDVLRICLGDVNATTAALTALVSNVATPLRLHPSSIPTPTTSASTPPTAIPLLLPPHSYPPPRFLHPFSTFT